jgi:hypothetical protein
VCLVVVQERSTLSIGREAEITFAATFPAQDAS